MAQYVLHQILQQSAMVLPPKKSIIYGQHYNTVSAARSLEFDDLPNYEGL